MKIEFDPVKSAVNDEERGLPFTLVAVFDFATASIEPDQRRAYPEDRYSAMGFIDARLHVLCFTPIHAGVRVISLRKANERELKRYATFKNID